jgi:hypothetical protein
MITITLRNLTDEQSDKFRKLWGKIQKGTKATIEVRSK